MLDHPRQVGQVVAFDFDQAQALTRVFGKQSAHQRRFTGATQAPQQGVVGGHAVDELVGVAAQLVALLVDADQVGQADVEADLQRQQVATAAITLPAGGEGAGPVDVRARGRQQGFEARENGFGAVEESSESGVHENS